MQVDILNVEWRSAGRDRESTYPVLRYLERKGYIVRQESIFKAKNAILSLKPKLILMSNSAGARENIEFLDFSKKLSIPSICFIAEGNIAESAIGEMFWGHNKDMVLREVFQCLWSKRSRDLVLSKFPELKDKLLVTGGTGFDRYQYGRFWNKRKLQQVLGITQTKIIGIAGWGFDTFWRPEYDDIYKKYYLKGETDYLRASLPAYRKMLSDLIANNPDVFFVLKEHPGLVLKEKSEFCGLENHNNAIIVKNEIYIGDLINASDLWAAFESTTCLEAWLLNKQTFLMNPLNGQFTREQIALGSPIFYSSETVSSAIGSFFATKELPEFHKLAEKRRQVIKELIQWDDGKNHLRAGLYIEGFLKSRPNRKIKVPFPMQLEAIWEGALFGIGRIAPNALRFKSLKRAHNYFFNPELANYITRTKPLCDEFDAVNALTKWDLDELHELNPSRLVPQ